MDESATPPPGRLESMRRIGDSALAILRTRLELVSLEIREEKLRALDLLLRAAAATIFGVLTMVSATALVVLVFWNRSPVLTLGLLTAVYALATVAAGWSLKRRVESSPSPFADTVAEFKKDCECWPKKP